MLMVGTSQASITLLARFPLLNSNLGTPAIQILFEYLSEIKVILFSKRQGGSKGRVPIMVPNLSAGWLASAGRAG